MVQLMYFERSVGRTKVKHDLMSNRDLFIAETTQVWSFHNTFWSNFVFFISLYPGLGCGLSNVYMYDATAREEGRCVILK